MILHVDMDAFFASIEQRDNPHLRDKPVVVGGDPSGRGIVTTCSYEARKYGIHSGMPAREAWLRCPDAIFVRSGGNKYSHASRLMLSVLEEISPVVEPFSIDEAFVDVTGSRRLFGHWKALAHFVRSEIHRRTGVTGSIGIAPTRLAAKLASKINKPNGVTIIPSEALKSFLNPIPVEKVMGIGPKSVPTYHRHGVRTIGDLLGMEEPLLRRLLGDMAVHLRDRLICPSPATMNPDIHKPDDRSLSHEHTFEQHTQDRELLLTTLLALTEKVGRRLRKKGLQGHCIILKLRSSDFSTHTHQLTLGEHTNSDNRIYAAGCRLFNTLFDPEEKVRLIGIRVSGIKPIHGLQGELALEPQEAAFSLVTEAMDILKSQFGEHVITRGSHLSIRRLKKGMVKSSGFRGFGGKPEPSINNADQPNGIGS